MQLVQISQRSLKQDRVPEKDAPVFELELEENQEIIAAKFWDNSFVRPERKTVDHRAELWIATRLSYAPDRDHWIRLFNRLEAAVKHHKNATGTFATDADEALYKATDRILSDAARGAPHGGGES